MLISRLARNRHTAVMRTSCIFSHECVLAVFVQVQLPVLRSLAVMCYKNAAVASEIVKGSFINFFLHTFNLFICPPFLFTPYGDRSPKGKPLEIIRAGYLNKN